MPNGQEKDAHAMRMNTKNRKREAKKGKRVPAPMEA